MKNLLFLLAMLCLLISQKPAAQNAGQISGTVKTPHQANLSGATILLKRLPDSSLMKTMLSDENGKFSFSKIRSGPYLVVISMIGFKGFVSQKILVDSSHNHYEFQLVTLQRDDNTLSNVTVKSTAPIIERFADRTVMNVESVLSASGSSALEMLQIAPGVHVDENSGISLRGKSGVTIFINDRPTYLSGADLINYLKSLPASTLDKIEVITNPPAKYDAAGKGGIINIKIKKITAAGFNGSVNLSIGQGKYSRSNNSLNFNYRSSRFNFFGTGAYVLATNGHDLTINRYYFYPDGSPRFTVSQNTFFRWISNNYSLRFGVDYDLTRKTTIGIIANGIVRPWHENKTNTSFIRNGSGNIDSSIQAHNHQQTQWGNGSINLNLLTKFNQKGKELSVDLDHVYYSSQLDQQFFNNAYAPDGTPKWNDALTGDLPSSTSIYSAKADYNLPVNQKGKISIGAKTSYVSTDNAANYFHTINNTTQPDLDKTNHFLYNETIRAAYVSGNQGWKLFSMQLGLRLENTIFSGHQLGNSARPDSSFKRSYTSLFPTAYFLFKLDTLSKHQLNFSYGRRIDRPYYSDLNPFISPLDKFSVYVGNPYLKPNFTSNFSLAYTYKNKITATTSYSRTKNIIHETVDLSNNIYINRPANIGKSSILGLGIDAALKPTKWWTFYGYAEVQKRHYTGVLYGYHLDTSMMFFTCNMGNQFRLNKGWSAELSGFYRTDMLLGQLVSKATGAVNIGVGKKVLHEKGTVRLMIRDIFYTQLTHGIMVSIKDAYATYRNWGDSRNATVSFSYNFGKVLVKQRNHNSAVEAELKRVK